MSVLSRHRTMSLDTKSPFIPDFERSVTTDENGNEVISFVEVDNSKIVAGNGCVDDWNLKNLLASGINPAFPIHVQSCTRLEGQQQIQRLGVAIDTLFDNQSSNDINVDNLEK